MHIYAIIYAYNLIYCLNDCFFYYNVQLKLSAFSHYPAISEGVDRGGRLLPLPPPYLPLPSPLPPIVSLSLLGAVRASRAQNSLPLLFSPLPPPLFPPPSPSSPSSRPLKSPSRPSSPTSPLPCPPPHISLACSKTVQRTITLTFLTHVFGKVYFAYHCAVCFNTTILWVL